MDTKSKTPAGLPLTVRVEDDQLVIRIGIETLAYCFEVSDENNPYAEKDSNFCRTFRVSDPKEFAKGVAYGLKDEREDGSTPLTDALDKACIYAVESDYGVEEDGRIATDEMFRGI